MKVVTDNVGYKFEISAIHLITGLPRRSTDRHAVELANLSLKMLNTIAEMKFFSGDRTVKLRIGIHTGTVYANKFRQNYELSMTSKDNKTVKQYHGYI